MDKELERKFLETLSRALVSLPFDLKVLLEATSDADMDHAARELAASAVVHIITAKDGNVERPVRHAEDAVLLRLALVRVARDGGEAGPGFRERFSDLYGRLDEELGVFRAALGDDIVDWLDSRWAALGRAVYARKKIVQFIDDEELNTFLYEEGTRFATEYPISEETLEGRLKQAQPVLDHLARKREQDRKKITS